jgi:gas vesicle protein
MGKNKSGLFFGVVMGTLLGVLFAPRKGKDLRDKVSREIKGGGLGVKTLGNNFQAMGRDIADTAHEVYEKPEIKNNVKKGTKNIKKALSGAGNNLLKSFTDSPFYDFLIKSAKKGKK